MWIRSMFGRGVACGVGVAALLGLAGCGSAPALTAATPAVSTSERAAAIVRPAVVRIGVEVTGRVTDPAGVAVNGGRPITANYQCTAFGVGADGYLGTAGHCVDRGDPAALQSVLVHFWLATAVLGNGRELSEEAIEREAAGWTSEIMQTRVTVELGRSSPSVPAEVVEVVPIRAGDVALLKIDQPGLPVLELGTDDDVRPGVPVLSLGYPGISEPDPTVVAPEPTITDGQISARRTVQGQPFYESTAMLFRGMSGGPTITLEGRVVGIGSFLREDGAAGINFIAPSTTLGALLARHGVRNEPGPDDAIYRAALDDYFSGRYRSALDRFATLSPDALQSTYAVPFTNAARRHLANGDTPPAGGSWWLGPGPVLVLAAMSVAGGMTAVVVIAVGRSRRRRATAGAMTYPIRPGYGPPPMQAGPLPGPFPGPFPGPYPGPPPSMPIPIPMQAGPQPGPMPGPVTTLPVVRQEPARCTACEATLDAASAICLRCGKPR
ncbi:S1 family peptidase [Pseudonocardia sp. TRM90224]|uniref:S1 family peptidase n=1 Tax=Pseudonocardia sp. TRM90224 TaxID=2812678 RepID=UPI001E56F832|nr:serine protease [Pseudonocardia sp. TRM90224]